MECSITPMQNMIGIVRTRNSCNILNSLFLSKWLLQIVCQSNGAASLRGCGPGPLWKLKNMRCEQNLLAMI